MDIKSSVKELIGGTPLVRLSKINDTRADIILKLEEFNPSGSVKDRAALSMVEAAKKRGVLKPGSTIIEPTSGNTGIGLAMVGAVEGYKVILVMPDTMSVERRKSFRSSLKTPQTARSTRRRPAPKFGGTLMGRSTYSWRASEPAAL